MTKKKPWLAALLNVILPGVGYIYAGKRKLFGVLWLIGGALACISVFTNLEAYSFMTEDIWLSLAVILMDVAFGIDAYRDAKTTHK
jgi:hypothetical protein